MKKVTIAVILLLITVLFLSTFIQKSDNNESLNNNNVVISVSDLNYNLNNIGDLSIDDKNVICATSRGLVKCNNNGEVIPDLASNIEISKDGIEYNFILKDDIYWSDGEEIKPEDIITYFKWLIKNESQEELSALLDIYGVKSFKEGIGSFKDDVALTTNGNNIRVRLNKKCDDFLLELSKPQYKVRRNLDLWSDIKSNYKAISYSGYYYINSVLEDEIQLKNIEEDKKSILFMEDNNKEDAMASYEIGQRDVIVNPPVAQISRLDRVKSLLSYPSGRGMYLAINSKKINISDRREIVKKFYDISEEYYEKNKKSVKFSEGSYFEEDMDQLNKLQNRKVMLNNCEEGTVPGNINILIEDDDLIENFSKVAEDYFYNQNINLEIEKKQKEDISGVDDYDAILFTSNESIDNRVELYSNMLKFFQDKKDMAVSNASNYIEDTLFNSYSVVPMVFINQTIATSNKVSNIKLDVNGNIDFGAIN